MEQVYHVFIIFMVVQHQSTQLFLSIMTFDFTTKAGLKPPRGGGMVFGLSVLNFNILFLAFRNPNELLSSQEAEVIFLL